MAENNTAPLVDRFSTSPIVQQSIRNVPTVVETQPLVDRYSEPGIAEPVEKPGIFQGFISGVGDVARGAVDLVTGGDRPGQDLPELIWLENIPTEQSINIAAGMISNMDPKARRDVIEENLPGVKFSDDNNIGEYQGKRFVVNKPGFTAQDAITLAGMLTVFIPAANLPRMFKGTLSRIGAAVTGAAGTQITLDKIAEQFGSDQGVNLLNAAVVGTLGGTFQAAGPVARRLFTQKGIFSSDGSVSKIGKKVLDKIGVDPAKVTREYLQFIDEQFKRAAGSFRFDRGIAGGQSAREAKRVGQAAEEGQFGIRTTYGQRTEDLQQLSREEHMRKGGFGPAGMERMNVFEKRQTEEIIEAANKMVGKLGRKGAVTDKSAELSLQTENVDQVFIAIQQAAKESDAAIQAAYTLAGPAAKAVRLDGPGFRDFAIAVRRGLSSRTLDSKLTPATINVLRQIGNLQKRQGPRGSPYRRLTLSDIEKFRRRLGDEINDATQKGNATDAGNIIVIKRNLDQWLDKAFDNTLFSGDQAALELMKKARSLRRDHALRFERQGTGDDAGRVIEKLLNRDTTNIETVDYLLGRVKLGESGTVIRTAKRLQQLFGKDSDEWSALRSAAAHRMIYGHSTQTVGQVEKGLGGTAIHKRMTEALAGRGREFSEVLFTIAERRELQELAKAIKKTVPERVFNPSGTADAISTLIQDTFRNLAFIGGAVTGNIPMMAAAGGVVGTRALRQAGAVRRTLDPTFGMPKPRVVPLWSATGATAGAEAMELQRMMADSP
jgi:hypothetical protein